MDSLTPVYWGAAEAVEMKAFERLSYSVFGSVKTEERIAELAREGGFSRAVALSCVADAALWVIAMDSAVASHPLALSPLVRRARELFNGKYLPSFACCQDGDEEEVKRNAS